MNLVINEFLVWYTSQIQTILINTILIVLIDTFDSRNWRNICPDTCGKWNFFLMARVNYNTILYKFLH